MDRVTLAEGIGRSVTWRRRRSLRWVTIGDASGPAGKNGRGECREERVERIARSFVWASAPSSDFSNLSVGRAKNIFSSRPVRIEKPSKHGASQQRLARVALHGNFKEAEQMFQHSFDILSFPSGARRGDKLDRAAALVSRTGLNRARKERSCFFLPRRKNRTHRRCRPRAACRTPRC